jgi:hypothetical protein
MNATPVALRRRLLALAMLALVGPGAARAAPAISVEGVTFPGEAVVNGEALQLNGVGLRAVAWLKGYAAGLYLSSRSRSAAQVLATPGAKRLQMRMLLDVGTEEFIKAFDKGIARNTPAAGVAALAERMARFDALLRSIGKVRKRDVIDLDWQPGRGASRSRVTTCMQRCCASSSVNARSMPR